MQRLPRWTPREIDLLAIATILATVALGFLVRQTLNPDGVSYLDLAAAIRRGDLGHFVQGYWSPLYPLLLAAAGNRSPSDQIAWAHLVNVIAVVLTIVAIWRWARSLASPWFGRAAIAALIVCSAEPPRVEALTPDLVLLCILTCIAYELLVRDGTHWCEIGLLFGAAYLAKTGIWPWLLLAMALRAVMARGRAQWLQVWRSHAATAIVVLCWPVPLSLNAGRPTFGATGRLNFGWYLRSSDARTPDTHLGDHWNYRAAAFGEDTAGSWALFGDDSAWTYPPWSDPEAWAAGITRRHDQAPTLRWLLGYWTDAVIRTASLWLRTLLLFVLLPAVWIGWRPGRWEPSAPQHRAALLVMALGAAGVAEYIIVHAEPRLIAPFALLFALAALAWLLDDRVDAALPARSVDRRALSLLGVGVAAWVVGTRIYHARDDSMRIAAGLAQLDDAYHSAFAAPRDAGDFAGMVTASAPAHPRIVVIGPALPVEANIFWIGGRIVAQVPPGTATALDALPGSRARDLVRHLFAGRADAFWLTTADGAFQIVPIR